MDDFAEPRCRSLHLFLEATDSYFDYKHYLCTDCDRIWKSSFFYQDWEPHWHCMDWAQFKASEVNWKDAGGRDHCPSAEALQSVDSFKAWVMQLEGPIQLIY